MVAPAIVGAGISAGARLAGGGLNFLSGMFGRSSARREAEKDRQLQREFAQHGIKWRVDDALRSGIHPLYALGGNIPTYSPVSSVFPSPSGLGEGLAQAGQDIGRAVSATGTAEERHAQRLADLALERGELENELIKSRIAKERAQIGPPLPSAVPVPGSISGQGDMPAGAGYSVKKVEVPSVWPSEKQQEAGAVPSTRWAKTRTGWQPVPSRAAFEDADISNPSALTWYWRNQILPTVKASWGDPPPDRFLPAGAAGWRWHGYMQEWRPVFGPQRLSRHGKHQFVPRKGYKERKYYAVPKKGPSPLRSSPWSAPYGG